MGSFKDKKVKVGVIGGTFSLLHSGHKYLIRRALKVTDKLIIGVTSDTFVRKMDKKHPVENFSTRVENLRKFLQNEGVLDRCTIVEINDFMGPAGSREDIDLIVVTDETLQGALEINEYRVRHGLNPLIIIVIEALLDDKKLPISSTRLWLKGNLPLEDKGANIVPSGNPEGKKKQSDNRSF